MSNFLCLFRIADCDGDTLTHYLVQYTFDDEEHPISLRQYGNSKRKGNFIRMMPSTLDQSHEPLIGKKKDPLFAVMSVCKESEGKNTAGHFVRIVTGAPEPMTVLCFNWSLNDLEQFCTGEQRTVLSVDPTLILIWGILMSQSLLTG